MDYLELMKDILASTGCLLRRTLLFAYSYALDAMASSPKYPDRVDTERPLGTVVFPYNPAALNAHRPPTDQMCNALCVLGSM